ncbi:MAG TPA: tetratricopeptide repeat protein [Dongiaceae bacterium]|nr:tetratricopeptide repeat protein [Dongiaceae bacterium]
MSRSRLVGLVLVLLTLLAYLPVRQHGFVNYDDPDYLTENPVVQNGLTAAGVKWAFTTFHASNWHPVTWLSHMLDCELFGLNPGPQHLVNVLFHAANAALLFWLLLRLTGAWGPAAVVAALFAWHPLHVESVAWAAERKDVLSTFFGLLALLAYARYAGESPAKNQRAKTFYALSLGAFALGLLAKPMLVTLPLVLLLLDYWPLRRLAPDNWRWRVAEKLPFLALTAASCVMTYLAQRTEAVVALERFPLGLRLENAVVAYAEYLLQMVWPARLAVIYPLPHEIATGTLILAAVMVAGISGFAWAWRRSQPCLLVGWLWYLGMLVPVIGLVQVGGQAMADRYTYLPLVGIFVAVVYGAQAAVLRWKLKPVLPWAVTAGVLAGCLTLTARQLSYWRDGVTLFTHTVAMTGDNAIARINLGVALEQAGQPQAALAQYKIAEQLDPSRVQVHNNLGNLYDAQGQTNEALAEFREALRLQPHAPLVLCNLATLLVKLGQFGAAMTNYAVAAQLAPADARPEYLMGKAELHQGRPVAAVGHFRAALARDRNDAHALVYLARVLAASSEAAVRNGVEAVSLAERANALTGGGQPQVLDVLAMAYAEAGRFPAAIEVIEQAIPIATAAGDSDLVAAMRSREAKYQAGQPWREPPEQSVGR